MDFRMRWPTSSHVIRQRFGENPETYRKFGLPGHEGVDLVAPHGAEVRAVADGFVSDVRLDGFSDPMLRPYGNQIRIQHTRGYETIYAHLSYAAVVRGQVVKSGQLIGLAGDTGHTTGAHLHLGLKHYGATLRGDTAYPYDLIDPEPFLVDDGSDVPEPPAPSMQVQVDSEEAGFLNVRVLPQVGTRILTKVTHGILLDALEDAVAVRRKIGQKGQWLWVRTSDDHIGWAAAWYVTVPEALLAPPTDPDSVVIVVVDSPEERLRMRTGPATSFREVARLSHGTALRVLEPKEEAESKVGQRNTWIWVLAPSGEVGFCAAWYLKLAPFGDKPVIPEPNTGEPTQYVVVDSPGAGLRLRAGPGTNHDRIWWMPHQTVLTSLDDPAETGRRLGQEGAWIHVRTPARFEGYAAAWYLRRPDAEDERLPVTAAEVPLGSSPHIFGIHAVAVSDDAYTRDGIRGLYTESGKRGWIFFTEICGRHAHAIRPIPEIRQWLWEWAEAGYGVIIRLNNGYEPGGTLPESRYYRDFAAAAARWVEVYLKDSSRAAGDYTWTIQIGNEQNNPREHPGGFEHPTEHITASKYADAFNRTYAAIKRVLPNAIVCPGAIDPYNYMPMLAMEGQRWRPLDYFETIMKEITALDGIILHAYTHGPELSRVTHLKRFGDGSGPLWDHYYDFQTYRIFMERIPAKWRNLPVYITEINHIHRPAGEHDQGWINQNIGWVREVYAEINRWNQMPYAQQIRCGLLYRWIGDAWSLYDKKEILTDFKHALASDYRWRADADVSVFSAAARPGGGGNNGRELQIRPLEERFLVYPDDLTVIRGIGEKTQRALRAAGIMLYEQLAQRTSEALVALLSEADLSARHADTWPAQATLASEGDWDALAAYRNGSS